METRRTFKKWCLLALMTFVAPPLLLAFVTVGYDLIEWTGLDGGRARPVVFNSYDSLCPEGEKVTLQVQLVRDEFRRRGVANCRVSFQWDNKTLGQAVTDERGRAALLWQAPKIGDYLISVSTAGNKPYTSAKDRLLCSVRPKGKRTLIVDIDNTLAVTRDWYFIDDFTNAPIVPGAQESLTALSQRYSIVYLTARMLRHRRQTLQWLASRGFPRNPAVFLQLDDYPSYNQEKYKTESIARLRKKCSRFIAGVGDKESDGKAYLANEMRAIIIDDKEETGNFEYVSSWPEVEQRLMSGLDV